MATKPVPHSTPGSKVTVRYPFHPHRGRDLEVVCAPRRGNGDGAVTVVDPTGQRLKIPCWMLSPAAAQVRLAEQAEVDVRALLWLADLVAPFFGDAEAEGGRDAGVGGAS